MSAKSTANTDSWFRDHRRRPVGHATLCSGRPQGHWDDLQGIPDVLVRGVWLLRDPPADGQYALGELTWWTRQGGALEARRWIRVWYTHIYLKKRRNIFAFSVISQNWYGTGTWNPSTWKTRALLSCIVNIIASSADALATRVAKALAAWVMT